MQEWHREGYLSPPEEWHARNYGTQPGEWLLSCEGQLDGDGEPTKYRVGVSAADALAALGDYALIPALLARLDPIIPASDRTAGVVASAYRVEPRAGGASALIPTRR